MKIFLVLDVDKLLVEFIPSDVTVVPMAGGMHVQ